MATQPFVRYVVRGPGAYWWRAQAAPFLKQLNWEVLLPGDFEYETSYGHEAVIRSKSEIAEFEYCRINASAIVEFRGSDPQTSVLFPVDSATIIDDLLAFMSLYSGKYCQTLWRETSSDDGSWSAKTQLKIARLNVGDEWASPRQDTFGHFGDALRAGGAIADTRRILALEWYFIAHRELEIGRPLAEAALHWVALESQAN